MQLCNEKTGLTPAQINAQAVSMKEVFSTSSESSIMTPHHDDDICETLIVLGKLCDFITEVRNGVPLTANDFKTLRDLAAFHTNHRIQPNDVTSIALDERFNKQLAAAGQDKSMWINEDGSFTDHFHECEKQQSLRALKLIKYEIWKILVNRTVESGRLHNSSALGTSS